MKEEKVHEFKLVSVVTSSGQNKKFFLSESAHSKSTWVMKKGQNQLKPTN
jgi:hypothetical protein